MPKGWDILHIFLGEKKNGLGIVPTTTRLNNVRKQGKHISRIRISCSRSIKLGRKLKCKGMFCYFHYRMCQGYRLS